MSLFTTIWNLLKKNPATDGNEMFNIQTMLNDNWDKIDSALGMKAVNADVRAATIANITLSGLQTVDGVALAEGDRVLVKNQATGNENGIYVASSNAWTRSADADTSAKLAAGIFVQVKEGSANAGTGWVLSNPGAITLGTTALTFVQKTGTGSATDAVIGTRAIDDTVAAASGADTPTRLWSKLAYMIKAITGKSNWYTPPATTIEALNANKLNASAYTSVDVLAKLTTVDGSGSGLDADMVDGLHAADITRKVSPPTTNDCNDFTTLNAFFTWDTGAGSFQNTPEGTLASGSSKVFLVTNYGYSGGRIIQEFSYLYPSSSINRWMRIRTDNTWSSWVKIWHSGNDGSGSGLDADMVDGFHATALMANRGSVASGDFNTLTLPGFYQIAPSSSDWGVFSNAPVNAYQFGALVVVATGNVTSQIYQPHNGGTGWGTGMYIRSKYNASDWGPWEAIFTSRSSATFKTVSTYGLSTSATGTNYTGQWTKIGSLSINGQYLAGTAVIDLVSSDSGSNNKTYARILWRVKQQNALGGAPFVNLDINADAQRLDPSSVAAVLVTNTTSLTQVDLFVKVNDPYDSLKFNPYIVYQNGAVFSWYELQPFSASLPAGTVTNGSVPPLNVDQLTIGQFPNAANGSRKAYLGRAADRAAGNVTLQLGGTAEQTPSFEIVDRDWTKVLFSVNNNGTVTMQNTPIKRHGDDVTQVGFGLSGTNDVGFISDGLSVVLGSGNSLWLKANNYYDGVADKFYNASSGATQVGFFGNGSSTLQIRKSTNTPSAGATITWGPIYDILHSGNGVTKKASIIEANVASANTDVYVHSTPTLPMGNYELKVYLRVTAAATVTVKVAYNDESGYQTSTLCSGASLGVGSYSLLPAFFAVRSSGSAVDIIVNSSVANAVKVSASVVGV
jgi:hypothetical protein